MNILFNSRISILIQFIPHGHCYLWKSNLVGLHLLSDLIIALAYYSIPITLFYFVSQRKDLPYASVFILFGAFIVSCGTTHLMEIWTLWQPNYWVSGILKAITALVSLYTALEMLKVVPLALELPSPDELKSANQKLENEIIDRLRVEAELEQQRLFLETIFNNLSDGIAACDRHGILTLFNQASCELFGMPQSLPPEQWSEQYNLYDSKSKEHLERDKIPLFRAYSGETFTNAELMVIPEQEKPRTLLANGSPIVDTEGEKIGAVVAVRDISDRKAAEQELNKSLREKEVMLQEIHHRVKNNLQVICSLLNLQSRYLQEAEAIAAFKETNNRVRSMALVHEQLYQGKSFSKIALADYVRQLGGNLVRSYSTSCKVEYQTEIEELYLDLNTAIPCGLIINEIISNAFKYAFDCREAGNISIKAFADRSDDLHLIIEDDGVGLPINFDLEQSNSLGLKLVKNLTEQLQGKFAIDSESQAGTKFEFVFQRIKQK